MNRLHITTRGLCNWRERLAKPDLHWKRGASAFETAVSWECASKNASGIPAPIESLFQGSPYHDPLLLFAVVEHKVPLPGSNIAPSQSDLWVILKTSAGLLSVTIEAKAKEPFGNKVLEQWLLGDGSEQSKTNRQQRWQHIRQYLPESDLFCQVRYQLLHRCASAVIEAKRFGLEHAAFIVQAFNTPDDSFQEYARFCEALKIAPARGKMASTFVDGISLSIGWADCPLATDEQVADTA